MMRWLAGIVVFLFCGTALAQTPPAAGTPEALSRVYGCANVADNQERLACYDSAVGRLAQEEREGRIVSVDREQVATIERESFGFSLPSLSGILPRVRDEQREEVDNIQMQVERVARDAYGRARFEMTNGQTWTQSEIRSPSNVRAGDTVTVRRAAMGSFMLVSSRGGPAHRVRREE